MALTANMNRSPGSEPFKPTDFMNFFESHEEPEMTAEELEAYTDRCLGA
jgi:hypothetical protein